MLCVAKQRVKPSYLACLKVSIHLIEAAHKMALCLTSKKRSQRWGTPPALLAILDQQYTFTRNPDGTLFDPCPLGWHPDTHPDKLEIDWAPSTFANPPTPESSRG